MPHETDLPWGRWKAWRHDALFETHSLPLWGMRCSCKYYKPMFVSIPYIRISKTFDLCMIKMTSTHRVISPVAATSVGSMVLLHYSINIFPSKIMSTFCCISTFIRLKIFPVWYTQLVPFIKPMQTAERRPPTLVVASKRHQTEIEANCQSKLRNRHRHEFLYQASCLAWYGMLT